MPDLPLADPTTVRDAIARALKRRNNRHTRDFADLAVIAAAEHIAETMRLSGLVVVQKPPAPAHTGSLPPHAPGRRDAE